MTRTILPDTNAFSELLRGNPRLRTRFAAELARNSKFMVSAFVYYELKRGLLKRNSRAMLSYFDGLISKLTWADVTRADAQEAAQLWADTHQRGEPREDSDIIIAAQANTRNAIVVTGNRDHFEGTARSVESWA